MDEGGHDPFRQLGNDIRRLFFSQFKTDDLASWRRVCKSWKKFIERNDQFGPDINLCKWHANHSEMILLEAQEIRDPSIRYLNFGGFTTIRIHCSRLTDKGMALLGKKIAHCQNLHTLELQRGPHISDRGFSNIASCLPKTLKTVAFREFAKLTAASIQKLGRCVPAGIDSIVIARWNLLDTLDFSGCVNLTDQQLRAFLMKCPKSITSLNLTGCHMLTDASAKLLVETVGSQIRELYLGGMTDYGPIGTIFSEIALVSLLSAAGRKLTALHAAYCPGLTGEMLSELRRNKTLPTRLVSLDVTGCKNLTFHNLLWILGKVDRLSHLSLGSDELTDNDLEKLLTGPIARMHLLRTFSLSGSKLTNRSFELLEEHLPHGVEKVDLMNCDGLDAIILKSGDNERARALVSNLSGSVRSITIDEEADLTDDGFLELLPLLPHSVRRLYLHGSNLTDLTLKQLDRQFKSLTLAAPKFTEKGVIEASKCLSDCGTALRVEGIALGEKSLHEILKKEQLKTLTTLCLRNIDLDDGGCNVVASFAQDSHTLTSLDLSHNRGLCNLSSLMNGLEKTHLKSVTLNGCVNIDWTPYKAEADPNPFVNLTTLSVSGTTITDEVIKLVTADKCQINNFICTRCTNLTSAALEQLLAKIFKGALKVSLRGCIGITTLDLTPFQQLDGEQLKHLFKDPQQLPPLLNIKASGPDSLTKPGLAYLLHHAPDGLEELDLSKTDCVAALKQAPKLPSTLKRLRLRKTALTCSDINTVLSKCSDSLEILDLRGCKGIDDSLFPFLLKAKLPKNLKSILLSGTSIRKLSLNTESNVTDDFLKIVLDDKTDWLDTVELRGCSTLTDSSLQYLSEHTNIHALDLTGCIGFTEKALAEFLQNLSPDLHTLALGECSLDKELQHNFDWLPKSLRHLNLSGAQNLNLLSLLQQVHSRIENLVLDDTNFADKTTQDWSRLRFPKLTTLSLRECPSLTDSGLIDLLSADLSQLETLALGGCTNITSECLIEFTGQLLPPKLKVLDCSGLPFKDKHIKVLAQSLPDTSVSLNLANCHKLTDKSLKYLQNSPNPFTHLTLSGRNFTPPALTNLLASKQISLKHIDLSGTAFRRIKFEEVPCRGDKRFLVLNLGLLHGLVLPSVVEHLTLGSSCKPTDEEIIAIVTKCQNLTTLHIHDCCQLTDQAVLNIGNHCPMITSLSLIHYEQLSDKALSSTIQNYSSLTSLDLTACKQLTGEALTSIDENRPNLISLTLNGCKQLSDKALSSITKTYPSLASLDLGLCQKLTDSGFSSIGENCKNLTSLTLAFCKQLSNETLISIIARCETLISLDLTFCQQLSNETLISIPQNRPGLTYLNFSNCAQLTDTSLLAIADGCQNGISFRLHGCTLLTNDSLNKVTCE